MAENSGTGSEQQALIDLNRKTVAYVNHQLAELAQYSTHDELLRSRTSDLPPWHDYLTPLPRMVFGMGCPAVGVRYVKVGALPSWVVDTVANFVQNSSHNLDLACGGFEPDGHKEGPAHKLPPFFWAGQVAAYLKEPTPRGIIGMSDYSVNFAVDGQRNLTQVGWFTEAVWDRQWAVANAVYPKMVGCVAGEFARLSALCTEEQTVYQLTAQVSFPSSHDQMLLMGKVTFTEDGAQLQLVEESGCALMDVKVLLGCALRTGKVAGRVLPSSVPRHFVEDYVKRGMEGRQDDRVMAVHEHFEGDDQHFVERVMGKPAARQRDARVVQLYEERPAVEWAMSMDGRNSLRRMPYMYPTDVGVLDSMHRW